MLTCLHRLSMGFQRTLQLWIGIFWIVFVFVVVVQTFYTLVKFIHVGLGMFQFSQSHVVFTREFVYVSCFILQQEIFF